MCEIGGVGKETLGRVHNSQKNTQSLLFHRGLNICFLQKVLRSITALVCHSSLTSAIFTYKVIGAYCTTQKRHSQKPRHVWLLHLEWLIESSYGWTGFITRFFFLIFEKLYPSSVSLSRMSAADTVVVRWCGEHHQRKVKGEMRAWGTRGDRLSFPLFGSKNNQTSSAHLLPATKQN